MVIVLNKAEFDSAIEVVAVAVLSARSIEGLPVHLNVDYRHIKTAILDEIRSRNPACAVVVEDGDHVKPD